MTKTLTETGNIQEALYLSKLSRNLSGPQLKIATAAYFIKRRQFDSAELCLDMVINEVLPAAVNEDSSLSLLINAIVEKALVAQSRKDFARAGRYLDLANGLLRHEKDPRTFDIGLVWSTKGVLALAQHDYRSAKRMFSKAVGILGSDNSDLAAHAKLSGGLAAYRDFDFELSLEMYRAATGSDNALVELQARLGIIDALTVLDRPQEAIAACKSLESDLPHLDLRQSIRTIVLANLREKIASNLLSQGKSVKAIRTYLKVAEKAALVERAKVFATLAVLAFGRGQPDRARLYEKEARDLSASLKHDIPEVLLSLSRLNLMRGHADVASQQLFDAIVDLPKGNRDPQILLPYDLMDISIRQVKGELSKAEEKTQGLHEFLGRVMPISSIYASILCTLGSLSQLNGDLDQAHQFYNQALSIGEQLHAPGVILQASSGLGQVALERHEVDQALQYFKRAHEIADAIGQVLSAHSMKIFELIAEIRMRGGPDERDAIALSELLEEGYRFESVPLDFQAVLNLAVLWSQIGDLDRAIDYFEEAAATAQQEGLTLAALIATGLLAIVLDDRGDKSRAEELLTNVLSQMEELGIDIPAKDQFADRYRDLTGFPF